MLAYMLARICLQGYYACMNKLPSAKRAEILGMMSRVATFQPNRRGALPRTRKQMVAGMANLTVEMAAGSQLSATASEGDF